MCCNRTARCGLCLFCQIGNLLKSDPFDSGQLTRVFEGLITNDIYYDVSKMKDMGVANDSGMKC